MALAVCLLFDRRSERAVRALWDRVETQGVPSLRSHTHGRHVPHVSYVVLRRWDLGAVTDALAANGGGEPVDLSFDGVGLFRRQDGDDLGILRTGCRCVTAHAARRCRRKRDDPRKLHRQRRGRAQYRAQGTGIEFEGFTYPERTINIEVAYDFTKHGYTERNYISDPVEYSNLFHWKGPPDRWRIHFPTSIDDDENELKRPEALQSGCKFLRHRPRLRNCGCNLYTVHQRVAKKFRVGRAVLAGDSAHVNSPIGGMGLNSGVHDAFNLADKLAAHPARRGRDTVLDRYERQRRHVAVEHTQAQTIRNKRLLDGARSRRAPANHDELRRKAEDPALARKFLLRTSLFESLREAEADCMMEVA